MQPSGGKGRVHLKHNQLRIQYVKSFQWPAYRRDYEAQHCHPKPWLQQTLFDKSLSCHSTAFGPCNHSRIWPRSPVRNARRQGAEESADADQEKLGAVANRHVAATRRTRQHTQFLLGGVLEGLCDTLNSGGWSQLSSSQALAESFKLFPVKIQRFPAIAYRPPASSMPVNGHFKGPSTRSSGRTLSSLDRITPRGPRVSERGKCSLRGQHHRPVGSHGSSAGKTRTSLGFH